MAKSTARLTQAVEDYFTDLRRIRAMGGGTGELSNHGPLANLLNAVGKSLKPKVYCVGELADQGSGRPDFGLYTSNQVQKGNPRPGQIPERGVVEVKPTAENMGTPEVRGQVTRYWTRYDLVLMTNFRGFTLVGRDRAGVETDFESYSLADTEDEFNRRLQKPRTFAHEVGAGLSEYLIRALSHQAAITEPKDLAWLLASYARDGLTRVVAADDSSSLNAIRSALEESLGVRFEDERGERFFHSTLVQTLFYGIFSAWVLWARNKPAPGIEFNWHEAVWHLRTPVMQALFQQVSQPGRLRSIGLVEVLNWTSAALDRVDGDAFFARFDEGEAVTYFYEPFLQAFDPDLRKQLGVWYTPSEVVRYMVARVDKALKDDLGIVDGLAAENVYVLDPCCGTGAFIAEVLRRIAANLEGRGLGALAGARVKQAATERVFGFEIMPAPFVVAHLQVDLALRDLDATFSNDGSERLGILLTNALTDWEGTGEGSQTVAFPELQQERDRAGKVKQDTPILVILGNPPYNGFAAVAVDEERDLSEAYRTTKRVRRPEGQGLNDPYVRFFRMAERRIAKTGQGVVSFISNYSWLDGLSHTGMREQFLDTFDTIRIDNLHGDRIISEYAPDGRTSETIFSIRGQSPGIKVGTSIVLLTRSGAHQDGSIEGRVLYRDFHQAKADERRTALLNAVKATEIDDGYSASPPILRLGLPFKPMAVSEDWFDWPALPDLIPVSFSAIKTNRDSFLIDTDRRRLEKRIADYFDSDLSHGELAGRYRTAMRTTAKYDAHAVRDELLRRGGPDTGSFVKYAYRPFDNRWLYWESESGLLDTPCADYKPHVFNGNIWIEARKREPGQEFCRGTVVRHLADNFGNGMSYFFPAFLRYEGGQPDSPQHRHNLTTEAGSYLECFDAGVEDLFYNVIYTLHDSDYRDTNAGALKMGWPRIPLPGWPDGKGNGAAQAFAESAARGRELAGLLDPETPVSGVTQGTLRPEIKAIAVPSTVDNRNMSGDDFAVTAGWGHYGSGEAVMPGQGRAEQRKYTADEKQALGSVKSVLGDNTFDIYLNDKAFWRNVPAAVWNYKLGGYQVLKKWLSYRERKVLDRALKPEEVQYFAEVARRIAGILNLTGRGEAKVGLP